MSVAAGTVPAPALAPPQQAAVTVSEKTGGMIVATIVGVGGVGVVVAVLLLFRALASTAASIPRAAVAPASVASVDASASTGPRGYTLTAHEKKVLRLLVADDVEGWTVGGTALVGEGKILQEQVVLAKELATAYDENEVAADTKYAGKRMIVRGAIEDIRKDAFGSLLLVLGGHSSFRRLNARFPNDRVDQLAKVKKAQDGSVACTIAGLVLGQVEMKDCGVVDEAFKTQKVQMLLADIDRALLSDTKAPPPGLAMMVTAALTLARELKPDSPCLAKEDLTACLKLKAKGGLDRQGVMVTLDTLRAAGVSWAQPSLLGAAFAHDGGR